VPQPRDRRPLLVPSLGVLTATDPRKQATKIESALRECAARINELDGVLQDIGLSPKSAIPAEIGIQVGMLVHVAGETAFKAVCTNLNRYATGIVTQVGKRRLTIYGFGEWDLLCVPFSDELEKILYLSDQPGFAQDFAPNAAGTIRQVVGFKKGATRNQQGKVRAQIQCLEQIENP
jgi:hypothetical protein